MSKIAISGASTGTATFTIESPATSTNRTLTLPDNTGTIITQNSTPAFASTIGVGGATAAASGAGITFPATQSASSDANTLDDYEEGTWTATLKGGVSDPSTPVTTTGYYTKIGDLVWASFAFNNVNTTGASGGVTINGLPFTSSASIVGMGSAMSYQFDFNSRTSLSVFVNTSSTVIQPQMSGNNTTWNDLLHNAGSARYLWASVVYKV